MSDIQIGIGRVLELSPYESVTISWKDKYVSTTTEHFVECMAWLLTNVDTDTIITKDGVEPDDCD